MNKQLLVENVIKKLKSIYGNEYKPEYAEQFTLLLKKWEDKQTKAVLPLTEKNSYLITYGDSIYEKDVPTLETLRGFLTTYVRDSITDVHLLPMFPYTSDDGFSVTDYRQINPRLGGWEDINRLSEDYRLMFDFVANHVSKSSDWFKRYLEDDPKYKHYFIPKEPNFDPSQVVRPRTTPLFHEYEGVGRTKTAWTTFSEDQVDLNFKYFPLLLETTEILLTYAEQGATSIRLDAIGFIWKESGTTCIHMPQAHEIIQLWNLVLDYIKPNTQLITETNVPHAENISYFGNGTNEAHMVYQFSLPPLVLYTLTTHDSKKISEWAKTIEKVSDKATYFNFLASHDGIGMRPTEGILTEDERSLLVNKVIENGGRISYKTNTDGSQSVYEMNINYSDALINKHEDIDESRQIQKIIAAHAILMSVIGVPAIYYHSLLGSRNDYQGLEESGINRRINREKLEYKQIVAELNEDVRRNAIFTGILRLLDTRKQYSAFSPYADQEVLDLGRNVFGIKRINKTTEEEMTFILNVDYKGAIVEADIHGEDVLSGREIAGRLYLQPYEFVWVK